LIVLAAGTEKMSKVAAGPVSTPAPTGNNTNNTTTTSCGIAPKEATPEQSEEDGDGLIDFF
jgi:hypothetical protein